MAKREIKVPKRIAGVKIPKSIRKGPISNFLNSSGGQLLLAEVLLAAGALYAARRIDPDSPPGQVLRHPIDSIRGRWGGNGVAGTSERFSRACRAGLEAFREAWNDAALDASVGPGVHSGLEAGAASEIDTEISRKKSSSSRNDMRREAADSGPH